jgi:hypothetical protein
MSHLALHHPSRLKIDTDTFSCLMLLCPRMFVPRESGRFTARTDGSNIISEYTKIHLKLKPIVDFV